jgi:TonB-linked SusC/RagA family outer membrane protein
MYKKLLLTVMAFLFTVGSAFAQAGTLTGAVTDASSGEKLPGANVQISELSRGASVSPEGTYEISNLPAGTYEVTATFIGYSSSTKTATIIDGEEATVDFSLQMGADLGEVVVTSALGQSREEKSLGYSVQEVSGEDISAGAEEGIIGSLAGKVSGVQVVGSSGANIGGSQKIRIRGANGLSDGQPLFVVDGTPISNRSFSPGSDDAGETGRDFGDLASDLNLQDVESVSVLKGASASALYGNRAANGVILVTTKSGQMGEDMPLQVNYSNNTSISEVDILPDYQNQYAGGYKLGLIPYTDSETGEEVMGLNYAADESWGPKIDGQSYRPWWSWYHSDFTGDGEDDYGTQVPLTSNPDNVRNFYETGWETSNSLAISGGSSNTAYRVSIKDTKTNGVIPNSELDKTYLNFNGSLSHNDKFTSKVSFNYVNTHTKGRPAQGYSPAQGNPTQQFNQWFQRQLDMDKVSNYQLDDGTFATWNIRSPQNTRPLYWNSPYFSVNENVPVDDRDRIYGNYSLSYNVLPNFTVKGAVKADIYDMVTEDRIATGGLELDDYTVQQRNSREMNYEITANYQQDFDNFSLSSIVGGNLRQYRYRSVYQSTEGGLSSPNLYTIEASVDRPTAESYIEEKDVRSLYGTATLGWKEMVYVDASLRNDWSSSLPTGNNSYFYYSFSGSLVFTELGIFQDQNFLSYGKIRASIAQVGDDIDPYSVISTYNLETPYGSSSNLQVPNTLTNTNLKAAISSDYEFGLETRYFGGDLRLDLTYYNSVRQDEILQLQVPGASGYEDATINAGEFVNQGVEAQLGATVLRNQDWMLDLTVNWATNTSKVNSLDERINRQLLETAAFGPELYATENSTWGNIIAGGYREHENGRRIVDSNGTYAANPTKSLGTILPDWTGGFRADVSYKNFSLGAFIEYQKGGQFYSVTRRYNTSSGLNTETVGENVLGNPMRNPVMDANGNTTQMVDGEEVAYSTIPRDQAGPESGGVLVEGVDESGDPVSYMTSASTYYGSLGSIQEEFIYDASYIKLRNIKLTYQLPNSLMEGIPLSQASVALNVHNAFLLYSNVDGVDPSIIQNGTTGFSWWEGGGLPGTRSIGLNVNLSF